jgi:hypothetical protein
MADFIRGTGYDRAQIAAHPAANGEAILPWLPDTQLWYVGENRWGTYMLWDAGYERAAMLSKGAAVRQTLDRFADDPDALLLLNCQIPQPEQVGLELLHMTTGDVFEKRDERYWLYRPAPGEAAGEVRRGWSPVKAEPRRSARADDDRCWESVGRGGAAPGRRVGAFR